MNAKITKDLLEKEVNVKIEDLEYMDPHSDNYKAAVDAITKLVDRLIELEKIELEEHKIEVDDELERDKLDVEIDKNGNENKDNIVKNVLSALGIVVPAVLTVWGTFKTIKFEETGTVTTCAGRNFFNKLFKK